MINNLKSVVDVWHKLKYIMSKRQMRKSAVVFILTLVGALVETLGVSAILPLVQALMDVEQLFANAYLQPVIRVLHITTGKELVILMCAAVCGVYIFKNLYLTFLSYVRVRFSNSVKRELSIKMMQAYMKRGYSYYLTVNSQEILRGVGSDIGGVYEILSNAFKILAEALTAVCICVYIVNVDIMMAGGVIILLGCSLSILILVFRKRMVKLGAQFRELDTMKNKYVYESILGIKDVLVFRKQKHFLDLYESSYKQTQKLDVKRTVATEVPAYFIEAICISGLILLVGIKFLSGTEAATFVPQLAAFAVAAFRVLPSIGRISSSFNQFVYACPSLNATYDNFVEASQYEKELAESAQKRVQDNKALTFQNKVEVTDICWQYPNGDNYVLNHLNMVINKGTSVALIGQSGAGKSTMADIILGLLYPQKGNICVDGVSIYTNMDSWGKIIGYVPQSVYLIDESIKKNIAYGVKDEEIDDARVWRAIEQAQLCETIKELPDGVDTKLGDRGIRFSGGQKQRVAIARALYNDPEILVLDEATAALDNDTESAVMDAIDALHGNKTLIIIAHRLTTIRNCDVIYEIQNGVAVERQKDSVIG